MDPSTQIEIKIDDMKAQPPLNESQDTIDQQSSESQQAALERQLSSYRVRNRRELNYEYEYMFYRLIFQIANLIVVIKTWNAPGNNNLQIMPLVILVLNMIPTA